MNWQGRFVFCLMFVFLLMLAKDGLAQEKITDKGLRKEFSEKNKRILQSEKPQNDWFYKSLAINYVVLNALDLATTFYSLDRGAKEANPIARTFIKNKPLAVLIKGGVTAGVLVTLAQLKRQDKKAAHITLGVLNLVYGFVLQNNLSVILQLNE